MELCHRFENLFQTLTKLEWTRNGNLAGAVISWDEAQNFLKHLNMANYAGHNDWRLPSKEEFRKLFNEYLLKGEGEIYGRGSEDKLRYTGFNHVQTGNYWSSTTVDTNTIYAWTFDIKNKVVSPLNKAGNCYAWPVRGGQ